MEYNNSVQKDLLEYIKTPGVLMTNNEIPYEYRKVGSLSRMKVRRNSIIPVNLYAFLLTHSNEIELNDLREFGGGLILNYISRKGIYR